jgi:hypothetical protein
MRLIHDAYAYYSACERCQKLGSIRKRNMMPLNLILIVELFDVWGIDFMGPFPNSYGYFFILMMLTTFPNEWRPLFAKLMIIELCFNF